MLHFCFAEEMHYESANLIHSLSSMDPRSIVGIVYMPNSVDIQSSGPQHSPHFIGEKLKFGSCKRHAVQHVGITAVERLIIEGKGGSQIVTQRRNRLRQ